jgi:ATP-dependent DNA helicase RecQ
VKGLAGYVDVHTYHGYCFHLLGRMGTLEKSDGIIGACLEAIRNGTVPPEKIAAKTVLVVDEFQDINKVEYALLQEIIRVAGDIRVIVVGDEDQNIYEFRGASAAYLHDFAAGTRPKGTNCSPTSGAGRTWWRLPTASCWASANAARRAKSSPIPRKTGPSGSSSTLRSTW